MADEDTTVFPKEWQEIAYFFCSQAKIPIRRGYTNTIFDQEKVFEALIETLMEYGYVGMRRAMREKDNKE